MWGRVEKEGREMKEEEGRSEVYEEWGGEGEWYEDGGGGEGWGLFMYVSLH